MGKVRDWFDIFFLPDNKKLQLMIDTREEEKVTELYDRVKKLTDRMRVDSIEPPLRTTLSEWSWALWKPTIERSLERIDALERDQASQFSQIKAWMETSELLLGRIEVLEQKRPWWWR